MKINYKPKKRKYASVIIAALLVIVILVIFFFIYRTQNQGSPTTTSENDKSIDTSKQQLADAGNDVSSNGSSGLPDNSTSTTSDAVETSSDISIQITNLSQQSGQVTASAKTSGTGTCVFTFKPADEGKPVVKQVSANTGCSISISQNEFSYLGSWGLTVTYYEDSHKTEASRDVTIN